MPWQAQTCCSYWGNNAVRSTTSMKNCQPLLWALAASTLMLISCSRQPIKPLSIPTLQPPPRQKPVAAMQPIARPPAPPDISKLSAEQQASTAIKLYGAAAAVAGQCLGSREFLIQWIEDNASDKQ